MADFPIVEDTVRQPNRLIGDAALSAGQSIYADMPDFDTFVDYTVPTGKWATVTVKIDVEILDSAP